MAKNIRRMLAMCMVLCMLLTAVPLQALAEEIVETNTTTNDGVTTTTTTTTTDSTADGNTTVTVKVEASFEGTKESTGEKVSGSETNVETIVTDSTGNVIQASGTTNGEENKEWSENVTPDDTDLPELELDVVPGATTPGSVSGELEEEVTDNIEGGSTTTNSDVTTTNGTINRDGSVSASDVTTSVDKVTNDLEALAPDDYDKYYFAGVKGSNGRYYEVSPDGVNRSYGVDYIMVNQAGYESNGVIFTDKPTDLDGYDFRWTGYGESTDGARAESMDVIYQKDPETGEPMKDADGNYIVESMTYTGKYNDGLGSTPSIFALSKYDDAGNVEGYYYGYCIDNDTEAYPGAWYKISNLEDSNYYPEIESAEKLRSIVSNGYWGTESGIGSLAQLKEKVSAYYGEEGTVTVKLKDGTEQTFNVSEVLDGLKEHEALTATQAAIWSNSNGTLATQDGQDGTIITGIYSVNKLKPQEANCDRDYDYNSDARMQAIYEWLMNLEGTPQSEATTIINEKNFISDMSLVVGDLVRHHDANQDHDYDNDVYNTSVNFTLAFVPGEKDTLDVYVYNNGEPLKDENGDDVVMRLAPEGTEGEGYLTPDENGVYTISGLQMSENQDVNFELKLEGTQHLEEGVYIYSAYGGSDASQTMVGIASGTQDVTVTQSMTLSFEVDEQKNLTAHREWYNEYDPAYPPQEPETPEPPTPPTPPANDEDEDDEPVPAEYRMTNQDGGATQTIDDEPVPLADAPKTGDESGMIVAMIIMLALGLFVVNYDSKKFKI